MSELAALADRAARRFADRFGTPPTLAAAAPGRVNLIGEHTDYNEGFVLPLAIDRWCVCVARPAAGPATRLHADGIGETIECSLRELSRIGAAGAARLPPWARYLAGSLVERTESLAEPLPEIDLVAVSNLPIGAGLSSSAAVETAAAVLAEQLLGTDPAPDPDAFALDRALDCQRAEHRWAGVPCGLMDQLASSLGRAGHALLIDCRDHSISRVPMPDPDEASLLVLDTGVKHDLAEGEYAARRAACQAAASALGVSSLREATDERATDSPELSDEQRRCVRHIVTENARTQAAAEALRGGHLQALGELMLASHASLRDDYRVSCPELDAVVEIASRIPGVFGCRMTGGGFGGCAIALAIPEAADHLERELPDAYRARTGRDCQPMRVTAADGAAAVTL